MNQHDKMIQLQKQLHKITIQDWSKDVFLSFSWWMVLIVIIGCCILWWKLVDRNRLMEILLYGLFVAILSTFFDVLGWNLSLWTYHYKLLPLCTPIMAIDFIIMPMTYMLMYQYFTRWSSFLIAHIILAAVFAFIGENILESIEFYLLLSWKHIYSFPIYVGIAVFLKWLINKIKQSQKGEAL